MPRRRGAVEEDLLLPPVPGDVKSDPPLRRGVRWVGQADSSALGMFSMGQGPFGGGLVRLSVAESDGSDRRKKRTSLAGGRDISCIRTYATKH